MTHNFPTPIRHCQSGVILLEAMIAIIIFSIGILGLVGALSVSVSNASEAQYRTEAAFLADSLVAQMQLAKPTSGVDTRSTAFASSPPGASFTPWRDRVTSGATPLPGTSMTSNKPTVVFANNTVTVSIFWQSKNNPSPHQYVVVTALE